MSILCRICEFSRVVHYCVGLTELCGFAPVHPVRRPVVRVQALYHEVNNKYLYKPSHRPLAYPSTSPGLDPTCRSLQA